MEDFYKFLFIAGAILIGIFSELNKKGTSKKSTGRRRRRVSPKPSPVEAASDDIPMPEAWGEFDSLEELLRPKPRKQRKPQPRPVQTVELVAQPPKKREETSLFEPWSNSAAQESQNSRQDTPDSSTYESADSEHDFAIHSAEEARRAIIWGEIFRRKY